MQVRFVDGEETAITVDSGVEEGVCPWAWGQQFGTRVARGMLNLKKASGSEIPHWGTRDVEVLFYRGQQLVRPNDVDIDPVEW
eukprot:3204558-Karenia_brevis.AAC.1